MNELEAYRVAKDTERAEKLKAWDMVRDRLQQAEEYNATCDWAGVERCVGEALESLTFLKGHDSREECQYCTCKFEEDFYMGICPVCGTLLPNEEKK